MLLSVNTSPDICCALNVLSHYSTKSTPQNDIHAKHLLHYAWGGAVDPSLGEIHCDKPVTETGYFQKKKNARPLEMNCGTVQGSTKLSRRKNLDFLFCYSCFEW
jgi:hypothetical protein